MAAEKKNKQYLPTSENEMLKKHILNTKKTNEASKKIPKQPMMDMPAQIKEEQKRTVQKERPKVIVKQMAVPDVKIYNKTTPRKYTIGMKASDKLTKYGGSWSFIAGFLVFLFAWMIINFFLAATSPDPYPFILLNLILSCLAAIQAPIILMSQNRTADRDRAKAERDYAVNRKAEREVELIKKDLDYIKKKLATMHATMK